MVAGGAPGSTSQASTAGGTLPSVNLSQTRLLRK
jgi:hypothetical protein